LKGLHEGSHRFVLFYLLNLCEVGNGMVAVVVLHFLAVVLVVLAVVLDYRE
jgi:hypothetical protein